MLARCYRISSALSEARHANTPRCRSVHEQTWRKSALQIAAVALSGSALYLTFRDVSLSEVARLIDGAGSALLLAPFAFCLAQLADTCACQLLARHLGQRLPLGRVFMAQVAGEAATLALPLGFVVGESLRPWLLAVGRPGALPSAVAAVTGRKFLLILCEGAYLALTIAIAYETARALSHDRFGSSWLIGLGLGLAVLFMTTAALLPLALGAGRFAKASLRWLIRVAPGALTARLARLEASFAHTDGELTRLFHASRWKWLVPALLYVGVWLLEGVEVWLILRALGADISLPTALYVEAMVATTRGILPLLPAGLGVQDAGYVVFFSALGLPDAMRLGAAFCFVKRSREALWCLLGALCFALGRRQRFGLWPKLAPRPSRTSPGVLPQ
jgi:glycosyltransferase 2 family protein